MTKVKVEKSRIIEVFGAHPDCNKLIVLSDGSIFTEKNASFANAHKLEFKLDSEEVLRADFSAEESGEGPEGGEGAEGGEGSKGAKAPVVLTAENWKEGKYGEIMAYAKSLNLEPTTPPAKGVKALILEIEGLLNPEG